MGQYYRAITKDCEGNITTYNRRVNGEYTFAKLMEHSWWNNPFVCTMTKKLYHNPMQVAWVGDYSDEESANGETNLYDFAWSAEGDEKAVGVERDELSLDGKYLVNHTKKLYLDCNAYSSRSKDKRGDIIHPLPLLTAIGNGHGGGDYYGKNRKDVGSWCYDLISVEDVPSEGYEPISYTFIEN